MRTEKSNLWHRVLRAKYGEEGGVGREWEEGLQLVEGYVVCGEGGGYKGETAFKSN